MLVKIEVVQSRSKKNTKMAVDGSSAVALTPYFYVCSICFPKLLLSFW